MLPLKLHAFASAPALALMVSACGGGSTIGDISPAVPLTPAPAPGPAPKPTPSPSPPPVPPVPAGPIGLQSSAPFATYADYSVDGKLTMGANLIQFSYSPADDRYTITLPGHQPGQLTTTGGSGSYNDKGWIDFWGTSNSVAGAEGVLVSLNWPASSDYKYTSFGGWYDTSSGSTLSGDFVYGIPTAAGDVPLSGTAAYAGTIAGGTDGFGSGVFGTVSLSFDFGAGTLSGVMKPAYAPFWDTVSLGNYVFRDTVYSTGSTTFSGAFEVNGKPVPSSFQGSFTGPQASELMATWTAPFSDPSAPISGTMSGVWIAKKP